VGSSGRLDPLRVGVLGCADIAWRRVLPALAADPDVRLVANASRDPAKADRFTDRFGGEPVHGYAELLARSDIDAVYVPLPIALHAEWIERALRAGKHVLAEKPLSTDRARTAELVELARSSGLVLFENFMFLHHSQHAAVRRLLDDGAIGRPLEFFSWFCIPPKPPEDIRNDAALGGGALTEVGVYPLRAALHFFGPELDVVGAVVRRDRGGVVLGGSALLSTPEGTGIHLVFGMQHAYRSAYAFSGDRGRLSLESAFTPPDAHRPTVHVRRQDHAEEFVLPADAQFANAVGSFVKTVRGEKGSCVELEASVRLAALVDMVKEAAHWVEC
jgi:NDP-hexose-3-ketoreductase